jgi:hypothetical protein
VRSVTPFLDLAHVETLGTCEPRKARHRHSVVRIGPLLHRVRLCDRTKKVRRSLCKAAEIAVDSSMPSNCSSVSYRLFFRFESLLFLTRMAGPSSPKVASPPVEMRLPNSARTTPSFNLKTRCGRFGYVIGISSISYPGDRQIFPARSAGTNIPLKGIDAGLFCYFFELIGEN